MLLLFILIGLLALGLPLMLMLFGDPPAPPAPPAQPKAAVMQAVPLPPPVEVPQAASSEAAPSASEAIAKTPQLPQIAIPASPPAKAPAAVTAAAPALAKPVASASETESIPGLPEGTKLPSEAELLRELQRLLDERAKAGKQ